MSEGPEKKAVTPLALTVADAARLLANTYGQPIEPDMLAEDIAEGAPTNADGTVNILHYGAWLVKEMARRAN